MTTGLGLRVIPSSSKTDVDAAIPIENEVFVTSDEGRVHASQVGVADAESPLRSLPFSNEVVLLGEGSEQGLTEFAHISMLGSHKHAAASSSDGIEVIASDLDGKGTVSLVDSRNGAVISDLIPLLHVDNEQFGKIIAASNDLSVVAVANNTRTISIFLRSGDSYSEILGYTNPTVGITSVDVSGDGLTVAVGYSAKSNFTGEVRVYRVSGNSASLYQVVTSATDVAGEKFGSSVSLSDNGLALAVGMEGDAGGKGAAIVLGDTGVSFIESQKISLQDAVAGDQLGKSIALSGDAEMLAIGADGRTFNGGTVDFNSGAVVIANKQQSGLFQIDQELQSELSGEDGKLGQSVAISGNKKVLFIGAPFCSTFGNSAGLVLSYVDNGGGFSQASALSLTGANANGKLGLSIALGHKGESAAVGSAVGTMLAKSVSKWRKSIPEVTASDIASGSEKQGSTSGKAVKEAVKAEVDASYEITLQDITEKSTKGGKASGKTIAEALGQALDTSGSALVDKISAAVGGTAWKGKNAEPPVASFTLDKTTGDSPVTFGLTNTSTAGENIISTMVLSFSDGRADMNIDLGATSFIVNTVSASVDVTLTVTDEIGNTGSHVESVTTSDVVPNIPPTIDSQSLTVEQNVELLVYLGREVDTQGENLTYTYSNPSAVASPQGNEFAFTHSTIETVNIPVTASDGRDSASAIISINVVAAGSIKTPIISDIQDVFVPKDAVMSIQPNLVNAGAAGDVLWSIEFGHDDIEIHPFTGVVSWDTTGIVSDSFNLVIKCENEFGVTYVDALIHCDKVAGDIIEIGPNEIYKTIKEAYQGGIDVGSSCVLNQGIYTGLDNIFGFDGNGGNQYPPSGNPTKFTSVIARKMGTVIFEGDAGISVNLWNGGKNEFSYVSFSGLMFEKGSVLAINGDPNDKPNTRPHHIKVIGCGGAGEDDIPLYSRLSDNIIFESCFAYGGGRYKISFNETSNCIARRNIARYDRSDRKPAEDPKGSHIFYNSMGYVGSNLLAIDDIEKFRNSGYQAGAFGSPVTGTSITPEGSAGKVSGCIQLNSEQMLNQFDYQISNGGGASDTEISDMISYDCRPHNFYIYSWGFNLWDKCTFAKVRPTYLPITSWVHTGGYNNFRGFRDCLFHDMPAAAGHKDLVGNITVGSASIPYDGGTIRTVEKYGMVNANLSLCAGLEMTSSGSQHEVNTTTNDVTAYLKYVPRLEQGGAVSDSHGGEVMYLIGRSGTFKDEAGFNDKTDKPIWPFKGERLIREKLRSYQHAGETYSGSDYLARSVGPVETLDATRGFCADGVELSTYVWGYMGNTVPPLFVGAVPSDGEATVYWSLSKGIHKTNVTGYRVYDLNPDTGALTNPRDLGPTISRIAIPSLKNGFKNYFAVTAVDSVKGESGFSYPIEVVPNGVPTDLPVVDTSPADAEILVGDTINLSVITQGDTGGWWVKNDVKIEGITAKNINVIGAVNPVDANLPYTDVYKYIASNTVGDVPSASASIVVYPVDSTNPTVSISLTGDVLTITADDDLYPKADLTLQLLDGGAPIGSTFSGSITSIDLSAQPLNTGDRTITVSATDKQNNTGISTSVIYSVGSPVFTDNFADMSKWTGLSSVNAGEAVVGSSATGVTNWWSAASKGTVKLEMKILNTANKYSIQRIHFGIYHDGTKTGCFDIYYYIRQYSTNGWVDYTDRSGSKTTLSGNFGGMGNADDVEELWHLYEINVVGTQFTILVDDSPVFTGVIPEDINPFTGTLQIVPDSSGDSIIRNVNAYA